MIYQYEHPETGEVIDVSQGMNDEHVYFDEHGVQWNRVFNSPQVACKDKINPYDHKEFVHMTKNKRGTIGDIMDASAELSERRKHENNGKDPVQQKHFDNYYKQNGVAHLSDPEKGKKPRVQKSSVGVKKSNVG